MTPRFHLPIGKPDLVSDASDVQAFRQTLTHNGQPFAGDRVHAVYSSPTGTPLPAKYKDVVAMDTAMAHYNSESQMVRLQLMYSRIAELKQILEPEVPIPIRVTYGPVIGFDGTSRAVEGGSVIGNLTGQAFYISLQDQNGFYLDPLVYFQLFEKHRIWSLPVDVPCPLLPDATLDKHVSIAGPNAVNPGQPFMTLRGGSFGWTIHNPPNSLPAQYCSFLSNDTIHIAVANLASGQTAKLRFTDVSDVQYRTKKSPPYTELAAATSWEIVPQSQLKPHHEKYTPGKNGCSNTGVRGEGKCEPGKPLSYKIKISLSGAMASVLETTISQDEKDVIRQEYLFHSKDFQGGSMVLIMPKRQQIERNQDLPSFVKHFNPDELQRSNYDKKHGDWILNRDEVYHVAEYMRRESGEHLLALANAGELPKGISSYGLRVTSSWRNPERNEAVGGVINSNHQFGRALDVHSVHINRDQLAKGHFTEQRKILHRQMFQAGYSFLEALISRNHADKCSNVEILLERSTDALWKLKAESSGTILSLAGAKYKQHVGEAPPSDDASSAAKEAALLKACAYATHVHIGWKPVSENEPLILPEIRPYDFLPPTLETYRNVILIAAEDDSVPDSKQLPLNHIASSVKAYLESVAPHVPTEIRVVHNPIEYLDYCNAFRSPQYKIHYFFSFSHAWPGGLALTHYHEDVPYVREEGTTGKQIHDPNIYQELNFIYPDPTVTEDAAFDFPEAEADYHLKYGEDDYSQIKTHQIRVSNLRLLSSQAKENMRKTFSQAKGIFIVGCRTADLPDAKESSFCQELAEVLHKPVYGAAYYSRVFQWDRIPLPFPPYQDGWTEVTLSRKDPAPDPNHPVVLIPGSLGGLQYIKWRARTWRKFGGHQGLGRDHPHISDVPPTLDIIEVYQQMLIRCDPKKED